MSAPSEGGAEFTVNTQDVMNMFQSNGNLEGIDLVGLDPVIAQQLMQLKPQDAQSDPNLNPVSNRAQRPTPSRQPSRGTQVHGPYVEIVEQPKARGLRFRYECEGRSAGSIPGENSTPERKTFPSIKIHNYNGPAVIVVSCVTKDEPYKPHPHNLVGKDCKKGVCTLRIRDTSTVSFPHLGIQCAKKKDVDGNLKQRQDINVDPFQTGFRHKAQNIDLNVVRLCFQVFLPDDQGKITRIVQPVVSQAIHDKKALNDLVICRVDRTSGKCKGGDEVFLLCEKINRDDIRVRFYEEQNGTCIWEAFGDFGQNDVHRQYAIVFKIPPYKDQYLQHAVEVNMQLQRSSDLEGSDPIQFTYQPEDPDPDRIIEKRKRKAAPLCLGNDGGAGVTQEALKARLKLKATRTSTATRAKQEPGAIKEEVRSPEMPQYSLQNLNPSSQPQPSLTMPNVSLLSDQSIAIGQMDTNTTIASQNSTSGGNVQYTPVSSQQQTLAQPQAPNLVQGMQAFQLLQQLTQTSQPNQVLQQPVQQGVESNPAIQQVAQIILALATQINQGQQGQGQQLQQVSMQNNLPVSTSDPNMQSVEMPSLSSFDPNLMQSLMNGESPMTSLGGTFGSFDGLSGADLDCDPNVAGFETVGGDSNVQSP